jgi:hypothetical protein
MKKAKYSSDSSNKPSLALSTPSPPATDPSPLSEDLEMVVVKQFFFDWTVRV